MDIRQRSLVANGRDREGGVIWLDTANFVSATAMSGPILGRSANMSLKSANLAPVQEDSLMKRLMLSLLAVLALNAPTFAYTSIYRDYVIKEAKACKKGYSVRLLMDNGDVVIGKWGGYVGYDYTAFVTLPGDLLATGYDIEHIVSIRYSAIVEGKI